MSIQTRFILSESEIPEAYYNIQADLPEPLPPVLNPGTGQPIGPDDLAPLFPMALIGQEVSTERYIEIPDPVRQAYGKWRPSPLYRAHSLEKALDTPAHIYYKHEGTSPSGSHKLNTALAQAFYNKEEGVKALTTETGAGQWGSALAMATNHFGLELEIFMVKISYQQKPYLRHLMEIYGGSVVPSPSNLTQAGRDILAKDPDTDGSLGMAISEAIEVAVTSGGKKKYSLGSVLNHVMLHQTVIGLEAQKQFELAGEYPDVIFACAGGGSNFSGFSLPFVRDKIVDGQTTRIVAVEPTAAPSLTKGKYAYDFGDTGQMTPLMKMHTLGHTFTPAPIHAGGLRYHGMAPIVCALLDQGFIEAMAVPQLPVFEAAVTFARAEGMVPAPESAHALLAAIDEALICKETGEKKVIAINLSGHGHFDMPAYADYFAGKLQNYDFPTGAIEASMEQLPQGVVPA